MSRTTRRPAIFLLVVLGIVPVVPFPVRGSSGRESGPAEAAARAAAYLVTTQNPDGSWGSPVREVLVSNWGWPRETYRSWQVATTSLCCMALSQRPSDRNALQAVRRGIVYMLENADLKRPGDWDIDHVWGWIYAIEGLSRLERFEPLADLESRMKRAVDALIRDLATHQTPSGGWGYYDFNTPKSRPPTAGATLFTTANAILALRAAERAGHAVPPEMLRAAVRAVERCRLPDGSYTYGVDAIARPSPGRESIHNIKGALTRIQVAHLALGEAGQAVPRDTVIKGLDLFFDNHVFLDIAYNRPIPHEAYYQNSGYFYLYGHAYVRQLLETLPPDLKKGYAPRLMREVVKFQSPDGSFLDYPLQGYGKPYGTAFALLALAE